MNPERVRVVRSGPDLKLFQPVEPVLKHKNNKKFLVSYLGVMGEFDGVDHLIKAANYIVNTLGRDDVQFQLIGSGPCFDDLVNLTKDFGLEGCVEFSGRVSDAELVERLSTSDVCVNPDPLNPLNDKSTMNKILEYMALAKPIVQYDLLEGKRSALESSLYAEPNNIEDFGNKILELCDADIELLNRMGEFGKRRMENELEWKYQSVKLIKAYDLLST